MVEDHCLIVLIVPYGIETKEYLKYIENENVLIVPYGIETWESWN